jgi:S-adenosylmethionine-dependent methyltransferase
MRWGHYLPEGRRMSGKDFGSAQTPVRTVHGDDAGRRRGMPSSLVSDALDQVLAVRAAEVGRTALDVVDVGAGTGGFAVRLAELGHQVTVIDPSPDALAAARWRAAELGVTLTAVQGEAVEIAGLVGDGAADLVVCHNVLEYVDSPAAAMTAIARVLRPGGTVSVLAANVVAAVLQRALAGRYDDARRLLTTNAGDPSPAAIPASGVSDHRRFTLAELTALIEEAGLRAGDAHGVRIFAPLLPGGGADPATADALRALETAAAGYPALRDIAARLHIFGHR